MLISIALFRNSIVLNRIQKCQFYHTRMLISNFSWNFENSKSTMSKLNSRITFPILKFSLNFGNCVDGALMRGWGNWFEFGIILNDFPGYSNSSFIHRLRKCLKSRNSTWQWGMKIFTERSLMTPKWPLNDYDKTTILPQNDHEKWKGPKGCIF